MSVDPVLFPRAVWDDDGKNKFKEYLKSVLGDDYYTMTENFFMSIWNSNAEYKVFLARRCLNLMYNVYRANFDAPSSYDFYSDSAFLANVPKIARSYMENGVMPEVLIVDDILIHGRTISFLINNYVEAVCGELERLGVEKDKSYLEDIVLDAVTVRTIVRSNYPLLIPNKYRRCLKYKTDRSDVWTPARWHELSSRISLIVDKVLFCNTSFVLSLFEGDGIDIRESAKKAGFDKSESEGRCREAWIKALKNSQGDTMAVYTFRITKSDFDEKIRIVPFVMMSDFTFGAVKVSEGQNGILDCIEKYFDDSENMRKIRSEALYLLLSHNLLLLLKREINKKIDSADFDIDKIEINFNVSCFDSNSNDFVKNVANLSEPLLNWNEMDKFILDSTVGSAPLFFHSDGEGVDDRYECSKALEDFLAAEGEKREKEAHLINKGKSRIISDTKKRPVSDLMQQMNCYKITETVGLLLKFIDMGIASVSTRVSNEKCCCVFHAGEQSLFIRAKRYARDIPVLVAMERDCVRNELEIKKRIEEFYAYDSSYARELTEFVGILYSTGQQISDWDINFLNWTEITDDERKRFEGKDDKAILRSLMFINAAEKLNSMERYRSIFHKETF